MKKRWVVVLVVAVLFGAPLLWTQLTPKPGRQYEYPTLDSLSYVDVSFENRQQNLQLGGMLLVPQGTGPYPAAVIIHGSGNSRRSNGWYLTLAESLQRRGILVLLPDKRGSEKSEGTWQTASFDDLATDTIAAIDYLNTSRKLGISTVGVVGMSQGGVIAPIVDQRVKLDYVVSVVGAAVPMHQQLVFEETNNLKQLGILPGLADLLAYPAAWSLIHFRQAPFWTAIGNFDPVPYWRESTTRVLLMYGDQDQNVPTQQSVENLAELSKPNISVKVYAGSGHALEDPPGQGNALFRHAALNDIAEFVLDR